jgi:hypothetical protein
MLEVENSLLRDENARQAAEINDLETMLCDMDRLLLVNDHSSESLLGETVAHDATLGQLQLQTKMSQHRMKRAGKVAVHRARQVHAAFRKNNHSSRYTNARKV